MPVGRSLPPSTVPKFSDPVTHYLPNRPVTYVSGDSGVHTTAQSLTGSQVHARPPSCRRNHLCERNTAKVLYITSTASDDCFLQDPPLSLGNGQSRYTTTSSHTHHPVRPGTGQFKAPNLPCLWQAARHSIHLVITGHAVELPTLDHFKTTMMDSSQPFYQHSETSSS